VFFVFSRGNKSANQNEHRPILRRLHHILKLLIRRVGRFELCVHLRHRFPTSPSIVRRIPKCQRAGALQDASRSPGRSEHPPGFGLRRPSAEAGNCSGDFLWTTGKKFNLGCSTRHVSGSLIRFLLEKK
jgi:hypothetical protein